MPLNTGRSYQDNSLLSKFKESQNKNNTALKETQNYESNKNP